MSSWDTEIPNQYVFAYAEIWVSSYGTSQFTVGVQTYQSQKLRKIFYGALVWKSYSIPLNVELYKYDNIFIKVYSAGGSSTFDIRANR